MLPLEDPVWGLVRVCEDSDDRVSVECRRCGRGLSTPRRMDKEAAWLRLVRSHTDVCYANAEVESVETHRWLNIVEEEEDLPIISSPEARRSAKRRRESISKEYKLLNSVWPSIPEIEDSDSNSKRKVGPKRGKTKFYIEAQKREDSIALRLGPLRHFEPASFAFLWHNEVQKDVSCAEIIPPWSPGHCMFCLERGNRVQLGATRKNCCKGSFLDFLQLDKTHILRWECLRRCPASTKIEESYHLPLCMRPTCIGTLYDMVWLHNIFVRDDAIIENTTMDSIVPVLSKSRSLIRMMKTRPSVSALTPLCAWEDEPPKAAEGPKRAYRGRKMYIKAQQKENLKALEVASLRRFNPGSYASMWHQQSLRDLGEGPIPDWTPGHCLFCIINGNRVLSQRITMQRKTFSAFLDFLQADSTQIFRFECLRRHAEYLSSTVQHGLSFCYRSNCIGTLWRELQKGKISNIYSTMEPEAIESNEVFEVPEVSSPEEEPEQCTFRMSYMYCIYMGIMSNYLRTLIDVNPYKQGTWMALWYAGVISETLPVLDKGPLVRPGDFTRNKCPFCVTVEGRRSYPPFTHHPLHSVSREGMLAFLEADCTGTLSFEVARRLTLGLKLPGIDWSMIPPFCGEAYCLVNAYNKWSRGKDVFDEVLPPEQLQRFNLELEYWARFRHRLRWVEGGYAANWLSEVSQQEVSDEPQSESVCCFCFEGGERVPVDLGSCKYIPKSVHRRMVRDDPLCVLRKECRRRKLLTHNMPFRLAFCNGPFCLYRLYEAWVTTHKLFTLHPIDPFNAVFINNVYCSRYMCPAEYDFSPRSDNEEDVMSGKKVVHLTSLRGGMAKATPHRVSNLEHLKKSGFVIVRDNLPVAFDKVELVGNRERSASIVKEYPWMEKRITRKVVDVYANVPAKILSYVSLGNASLLSEYVKYSRTMSLRMDSGACRVKEFRGMLQHLVTLVLNSADYQCNNNQSHAPSLQRSAFPEDLLCGKTKQKAKYSTLSHTLQCIHALANIDYYTCECRYAALLVESDRLSHARAFPTLTRTIREPRRSSTKKLRAFRRIKRLPSTTKNAVDQFHINLHKPDIYQIKDSMNDMYGVDSAADPPDTTIIPSLKAFVMQIIGSVANYSANQSLRGMLDESGVIAIVVLIEEILRDFFESRRSCASYGFIQEIGPAAVEWTAQQQVKDAQCDENLVTQLTTSLQVCVDMSSIINTIVSIILCIA